MTTVTAYRVFKLKDREGNEAYIYDEMTTQSNEVAKFTAHKSIDEMKCHFNYDIQTYLYGTRYFKGSPLPGAERHFKDHAQAATERFESSTRRMVEVEVDKIVFRGNQVSIGWTPESKSTIETLCPNKVELQKKYPIERSENIKSELNFYALVKDSNLTDKKVTEYIETNRLTERNKQVGVLYSNYSVKKNMTDNELKLCMEKGVNTQCFTVNDYHLPLNRPYKELYLRNNTTATIKDVEFAKDYLIKTEGLGAWAIDKKILDDRKLMDNIIEKVNPQIMLHSELKNDEAFIKSHVEKIPNLIRYMSDDLIKKYPNMDNSKIKATMLGVMANEPMTKTTKMDKFKSYIQEIKSTEKTKEQNKKLKI